MGAFSTAIVQFFSAITVFFGAFEKIAKTADNLATVAEEASGTYVDEARADRQAKIAARALAAATADKAIAKANKPAITA